MIDALARVASRLSALGIRDCVFLGGAAVGLLLTDPAAADVRATDDVDVVTPVRTRQAYNRIEEKLRAAGYRQPDGGPICRWVIDGTTVDLMAPLESILGFTNRWYADVLEHAQTMTLFDGSEVRLITPTYFVATKLEAFIDRGKSDYRFSHDLTDIIILVDGREELADEVAAAPLHVRSYIANAFGSMVSSDTFRESLPGHLHSDEASQERSELILDRMGRIADLVQRTPSGGADKTPSP